MRLTIKDLEQAKAGLERDVCEYMAAAVRVKQQIQNVTENIAKAKQDPNGTICYYRGVAGLMTDDHKLESRMTFEELKIEFQALFSMTEAIITLVKGWDGRGIEEWNKGMIRAKLALDTLGSEQCPHFRCDGVLRSFGVESTCLASLGGTDPNQKIEGFECAKCGRHFSRSYKWVEGSN